VFFVVSQMRDAADQEFGQCDGKKEFFNSTF
jgi:hypothetical protein